MGHPHFRPKEYHYGLQAADVLVYELGLDLALRNGQFDKPPRPEFKRLEDHAGLHGGYVEHYYTEDKKPTR